MDAVITIEVKPISKIGECDVLGTLDLQGIVKIKVLEHESGFETGYFRAD